MECKDYTAFSEKELLKMLGANERQENKLKAQLNTIAQERHFIKDAIMQKWREPSDGLLSKKATKAVKKAKEPEFYTLETSPSFKKWIDKYEAYPQSKKDKIRAELDKQIKEAATNDD